MSFSSARHSLRASCLLLIHVTGMNSHGTATLSSQPVKAQDAVFAAVVGRLPGLRNAMIQNELVNPALLLHYPRASLHLVGTAEPTVTTAVRTGKLCTHVTFLFPWLVSFPTVYLSSLVVGLQYCDVAPSLLFPLVSAWSSRPRTSLFLASSSFLPRSLRFVQRSRGTKHKCGRGWTQSKQHCEGHRAEVRITGNRGGWGRPSGALAGSADAGLERGRTPKLVICRRFCGCLQETYFFCGFRERESCGGKFGAIPPS